VGAFGVMLIGLPRLWPDGSPMPAVFLAVSILLLAAFLWFFRDPDRSATAGLPPAVAVSPADGRVVETGERPEGPFLAIYLNLLNVHVTRLPLAAEIEHISSSGGTYRAAGRDRTGTNARVVTDCLTENGSMCVCQIAGLLARRIVPYLAPGERQLKGARLGLIRFGSRVEVTFPPGYRIIVTEGTRVRAGESAVAEPAPPEGSGVAG
jgi:phosphatidylserine decarboxylase